MDELRSPAYWIGHFFVIAATVIGVFYAAIAGFDVALRIELIHADRGTYYVAESLNKELTFNVENMDKYIARVKGKPNVFKEHISGIKLNDFVFQAAKYSESTFEIEPSLLTEVSIYYFAVGNAIDTYNNSGMQSPHNLMVVVKRETAKLKEQKTLARLTSYNKALAESIEDRGVSLAQPSFSL